MRSIQLGDELISFHTRVLSQRTWQSLKGFSELLDGILLQTWAGLQRDKESSHVCILSAGEAVQSNRNVVTHSMYTTLNVLKYVYLSIWGELFGEFNLSGSCSRYQSFILQMVWGIPKYYQEKGVSLKKKRGWEHTSNTAATIFCSLIFEPRFPTVIYYVDLPWPEPWRCWLHHLQPSQCHPSGCLWSLWAPVLRWLLPPSLLKTISPTAFVEPWLHSSKHQACKKKRL